MMYTREETDVIVISGFELSLGDKRMLLSYFTQTQSDFKNHENLLIKRLGHGVYNKVRAQFFNPDYRAGVLKNLENSGVKCVTYCSEEYPETLRNIQEPPLILYCKGDTSLLKSECFAVVGSRKTLTKVLEECKKISARLSEVFTVVTGVAEGADSSAIEGALDTGGKVICVLPGGLDRIYPAANAHLCAKVESSGLLVSEYPLKTSARRYHFYARNRIIAGLCRGTLVVSAGEKSGALITANHAVDNNRDVFAFPYSVGISSGAGCNSLIKKGARLTENILDIFEEYGLDFNKQKSEREKPALTDAEISIYNMIKSEGEAFLPAVADKLGKPLPYVNAVISSLEIKKYITRLGGNKYSTV